MPANKYALLRYRVIDRCLRNKRKPFPSKEVLRSECEQALYGSNGERISASTIEKDLWAMRNESELGYYAPIAFSGEHQGYFYTDSNFTIAELPLTDDDLNAIRAAAETLFQFRHIPLFGQFGSAIEKIMDRMRVSAVDEPTGIIQFERTDDYKGSEHLAELYAACKERRWVQLSYQKFGKQAAGLHRLAPFLLKEYRNRWYVIGQEADDVKTFSLDRIESLMVLDERFADLPFDAEHFFDHSIGITVTQAAPEEVIIDVGARLTPYFVTQPLHKSQRMEVKADGTSRVHLKVQVTVELISLLLGYADEAVVMQPRHLSEQLKIALTQCLERYK